MNENLTYYYLLYTYSVGDTAPGINWFHWLNDTIIVVEFLESMLPAMSLTSSGGSITIQLELV